MPLKSNGLVKNYILLTGGEIASKIVTFAAMAYLARIASPVGFGQIEFAAAILLCAGLIVDQGFNIYGAREIAKNPEHTNALASEIVFVRYLLAILAYLGVAIFAYFLDRPLIVKQLILIYGLSLFGMPLLMYWVFQGHNRMGLAAVLQAIRQFVFAGVVFGFIHSAEQIWIAGLAETAGVFVAGFLSAWAVHQLYNWRLFSAPRLTRRLFTDGVPIGLSQVFWMVRMYGATVIIGMIAAPQDVGYFSSAMRILIALHAFIYLYYFNLLPTLSQTWQRLDGAFASLIQDSYRLVAWAAMLIAVAWIILAPWAVTFVYGAEFAPAGVVLQILAGVFVGAAIDGHYRYGLIVGGNQKQEMLTALLGAAACLVLIPTGYALAGLPGSAFGLVLAEGIIWASTWWIASLKIKLVGHARLLLRPTLALFATIGLLLLLPDFSFFIQALLAVATIAVLAFLSDPPIRKQVRNWLATGPFRSRLQSG